jgi:hypothetical protein
MLQLFCGYCRLAHVMLFLNEKKVIDQLTAHMRLFQHVVAVTCGYTQGGLHIQGA